MASLELGSREAAQKRDTKDNIKDDSEGGGGVGGKSNKKSLVRCESNDLTVRGRRFVKALCSNGRSES